LVNCAKPAAEVVIEAADQTVPVDTGKSKAELGYKTRFSGDGDGTTLTVNIGPSSATWYDTFDEFGTRTQPAQHWLARAWEASQDKCLSVFATEALARLADMEDKK
jgi:HK97 gp10 family phage protein